MSRNFDPSNDKVSLGDVIAAQFPDNTAWSFGAFFRSEDFSSNRTIIAKYDAAASTQQMRMFINSSGNIRFRHNADTDSVTFGSVSVNVWYMVAVTSDSSGNINVYLFTLTGLDDSDTLVLSGDVADLTTPVTIGIREDDANDFDGDIAYAFYFDVELSQIRLELYRADPGLFVAQNRSSTVYFLPLEGFASPEPDYSGNENSGTVTGAVRGNNPPVALLRPGAAMVDLAAPPAVGNPWYYYAQQ